VYRVFGIDRQAPCKLDDDSFISLLVVDTLWIDVYDEYRRLFTLINEYIRKYICYYFIHTLRDSNNLYPDYRISHWISAFVTLFTHAHTRVLNR